MKFGRAKITGHLDNIITLGGQVHLINESAVASIVKEYFDYKKYSRITWHETIEIFNNQYAFLISKIGNNKQYDYEPTKATRIVKV